MLVMGDMPLGKRAYWPIYAAAERLGLADRHPCRLELSQPADLGRLGLLSHRGLRRAGAGVPDPIDQPDRRRRVRAASEPENGDAGIGLHLAAAVPVAAAQVLARHPDGNAVGGPRAAGNCAQQHPLFAAAGRRAAGSAVIKSAVRPYAVGRIAPILDRLSALAIRRRCGAARGDLGRPGAQDHDRQSLCDLLPPEAASRSRRPRHEHPVPRPSRSPMRPFRRRPRSPIATSIPRAPPRPNSIPIWQSAGMPISKPTTSIPIRA